MAEFGGTIWTESTNVPDDSSKEGAGEESSGISGSKKAEDGGLIKRMESKENQENIRESCSVLAMVSMRTKNAAAEYVVIGKRSGNCGCQFIRRRARALPNNCIPPFGIGRLGSIQLEGLRSGEKFYR